MSVASVYVVADGGHRRHQDQQYGCCPAFAMTDGLFQKAIGDDGQKHSKSDADALLRCRGLQFSDFEVGDDGPVPEVQRVTDQTYVNHGAVGQNKASCAAAGIANYEIGT